jgi:hypothetical protein
MKIRKRRLVVLVLCAAVVAALWRFESEESAPSPRAVSAIDKIDVDPSSPSADTPRRSSVVAPNQQTRPDRPAVASLPPPRESERSHLADQLHAPNRTGMEDLSVVLNLFTHYRTRFQGYPVGEDNATFVNALTGNNPGRLAFISRDHPAIDAQGQLLDRWGEPFFFHLLGHDALEIRSAGPDRELYTPDDLLTASPAARNVDLARDGG